MKHGRPMPMEKQGSGEGGRFRDVLHVMDINTAEALSLCGKTDCMNARHVGVDVLKSKGLVSLMSMIEADPELSRNSAACRQGQIAAALLLQRAVLELPSITELLLQEKFLEGLVLMLDEGNRAMQVAAATLLTELANTAPACKAICQAQGGLVLAMMLKTSRGAAARAAAAGALMKLLPQLTPLERQILWSAYPDQLPPPAHNGARGLPA